MLRLITLIALLSISRLCFSQPTTPLVYKNVVNGYENQFVIGDKNSVSGARYRLNGDDPIQFDRLTFIKDVEFPDGRDNSPPIVRGWMYKGSDKTENTWRIIFGKEENTIPGTYPIYYSFAKDGEFTRWQVAGGTTRRSASFDVEIHSILWAHQVDVDRLGLRPFSKSDQSPLSVMLAWREIEPDLRTRVARDGVSFHSFLLNLPDGRTQVALETKGNNQSLFRALNVEQNPEVVSGLRLASEMVLASDVAKQYFSNNKVDFEKVAAAIDGLVRNDSPQLASKGLSTKLQFLPDECEALTSPWQPLLRGSEYTQFWKLRFGFKSFVESQQNRYALSLILVIGECRTSETEFGERFIIAKYESLDAKEFLDFTIQAKKEGDAKFVYPRPRSTAVVAKMPYGYSEAKPMESFTLRDLFNDTFQRYVNTIQGK